MQHSDFSNESEIQETLDHALRNVDGLWELVENFDYLDTFKPSSIAESRIHNSFMYCQTVLTLTEIISANENISMKAGEVLKPDFLLYSPESACIVILEIKNHRGASRQTGTELSAYAAEIKSYFPYLSDGDLVNVIISSTWPTLLRHHIAHEVFWMHRKIICLTPKKQSTGLTLKVIDISAMVSDIRPFSLHPSEIGGFNLSLHSESSDMSKVNRRDFDKYLPQLKTALISVQATGELHNSHGFAFLWKNLQDATDAFYVITFASVASFQGLGKILLDESNLPVPSKMSQKFINVIGEYPPMSHGESLSQVSNRAKKMVERFCTPLLENYLEWEHLKHIMLSQGELVSFVGWGAFRELFIDSLQIEYSLGTLTTPRDCPKLGMESVESVIDSSIPYIDLGSLHSYIGESGAD